MIIVGFYFLPKNQESAYIFLKNEKVWQTQVKAIYVNNIRCHFSATLCFITVLYYLAEGYGGNFNF
jgi:hypothetical protein